MSANPAIAAIRQTANGRDVQAEMDAVAVQIKALMRYWERLRRQRDDGRACAADAEEFIAKIREADR